MRIVIVSESASEQARLRQEVLGAGLECGPRECVVPGDLQACLGQSSAQAILVQVGGDFPRAASLIEQIGGHTRLPVLAVGPALEPSQVVTLLRGGAREYLDATRFQDELLAAIKKLTLAGLVKTRQGRTFAVVSANPGSGVTTTAAGLAFSLAKQHPGQVLLAELGTGVPELAIDLGLDLRHGVSDLLGQNNRMDATMVRQVLAEHEGGAHLLAYQAETLSPSVVTPEAMKQTVLLLRTMYDFSVIDLGHGQSPALLEAIKIAEAVVLVVRLDIPSLRLAKPFLKYLLQTEINPEKVRLAASRYGLSKQVPAAKAEEVVGVSFKDWIPEDPANINRALNEAMPVVSYAPRSSLARCYQTMAKQLSEVGIRA